jgi:GNAT superfamily N-acetyltransferase
MNVIEVNGENVHKRGFFCYMSKKSSEGYKRKLAWLEQRFHDGLKIKMLDLEEGGRGFIEYIPGGFAWRAVCAEDYMFIHCLWVVGQSKGRGYATLLLNECVEDAKTRGMSGVAVLTSERPWLAGKQFFVKHGFEVADEFPPFMLMAKRFGDAEWPSLPSDFGERPARYGKGLTIVRSDQCPYVDAAARVAMHAAQELGIGANLVELQSPEDVRNLSPSPYGVFGIVYSGKLVTYHYLAEQELLRNLISL